jgi:hypothetical protein
MDSESHASIKRRIFQVTSRREFERLAASNPDTLTDLERAGRFLYLQPAPRQGRRPQFWRRLQTGRRGSM